MQKPRSFIQEHRNLSTAIGGILAVALIGCCIVGAFTRDGENAAPQEVTHNGTRGWGRH